VEINDLRSALQVLEAHGDVPEIVSDSMSCNLEVARHYVRESAGVPASAETRPEKMLRYDNCQGHSMPVLMGVFGSRKRNQIMMTGKPESYHPMVFKGLGNRLAPQKIANPVCQQVVINSDIDLMSMLPILTLTEECAGPYITMGLVLARDPESGAFNASIHRFCIHDKDEMTISIFPGHHLGNWLEAAQKRGETLPISINLGLDPAIYFASCLTEPIVKKGESELDIAGGMRGKAVEISDCLHVKTECISRAEIVIEAEITATMVAENQFDTSKGSMPEFAGYQGKVNPNMPVPIVKVKAITHRENAIYQALVGPGLEQSELQAIAPEIAAKGFISQHFDFAIKDAHFNTAGGGVLTSIIQVQKSKDEHDKAVVEAAKKVLSLAPPFKHMFIVDEDINPHSPEDVFFAMTTRFTADTDVHTMDNDKPFPMDPSQSVAYRQLNGAPNPAVGVKAVFDLTAPFSLKHEFKRPFVKA